VRYVRQVIRIRDVARGYWFELLIAFLAIAGMLELVVGRDSPGAPPATLWIAVPAVAVLVLPLFARRRFPFAAPAAYWILAATISFGDGLLLAFIGSLGLIGLASAFLLGNLRDPLKAGVGLIIVVVGIVVVVYNIPGPLPVGDFVFIPLRFVVAWLRGTPCVSGPSRPKRRRSVRPRPNASARRPRVSRWQRSVHGLPASFTTSLPMPSA
jgi:hypothetical protein